MNKRFRKGMVILVTLTFLMQSVVFTSPAMFSVYAEADQTAVAAAIAAGDGTQNDATDNSESIDPEAVSEGDQPAGTQGGVEESPGLSEQGDPASSGQDDSTAATEQGGSGASTEQDDPAVVKEQKDSGAGTEQEGSGAAVDQEGSGAATEQAGSAKEESEEPAEENSDKSVEEVQDEPAPAAEPEEAVTRDAKAPAKAPAKGAGDLTILAFTSDIHNQEDGIAKERLDSWIDYVEEIYGQPIDSMNFCGDMGAASANESQFWTYTRAVMDVVDGQEVHGFYTTGNHEYYNGKFKTTTDSIKGEFVIGAEDPYTTGANYHMYALGTTVDWNGSGSRGDQYEQEQIDALTAYLDQQEGPEPIIVLAHFPLHRYNSRTTAKAEGVIDALNAASQEGKKIVFLWGHNHTLSDTNYDQIFKPGDTIEYASGSSKQIDFYYASAGCMSDSEYGSGGWGGGGTSGSAYVKGKGLVITIDDQNRLSFAYYNATGTDVTEGGPFSEGEAVTAESIALSPKELSVAVGDSAQVTVTYTPATTTQRTVTWTSSDETVATVDSAGKVTGVKVGTATITATYAGDGTITDTCTVTVKRAPGSGVTPENGKKYVILAGDEYALTSEGDEVGYSNGSGDQIFHYYGLTGEAFTVGETVTPDHLLWTFETSEDGTGYYIKANTGEYLNGTYAENDEGGSTGTLKLDETKDVWIITGMTAEGAPAGAHILKSTNASATASSDKYLTHGNGDNGGDNTNIFTLRSGDNATAVIFYEYNDDGTAVEDPDDPPVDPPTPTDGTVYKLVDQFTSGSDYLIVSRNDAGSGYALTNPGGTSSGASMGSSSVTVQNGDIDGDGTDDMYISTDAADVVWKASANGERFDVTNGSDYLEGKSGKVSIFDSQQYTDRGWTYTDRQLKHAGGNNTYVVYCEDGTFTATYDATSNEVYLYEKTETVQGEDPVESVELNKESLTLTEGDSATLTATVKPATAADKSVNWTTSDEAIATVDEHGKVTAVAEGTATITVTTTDGGKTATCEVTVEAAPPATKYVLTDTLEAGKEYLIVNDATVGGSGSQALKNPGGTSGGVSPGKTAVTVLDDSSIETADTDIVWTATENEGGFYLTNNGDYLEVYQGNLRIYNPVKQGARYWTYADNHLTHRGGSNPYYVAYSNGAFAYSSSAAEIYLFVKWDGTEPPEVTYTFGGFTWTGSDEEGYTAAAANYIGSDGTQKTVDAAVTAETTEATCTEAGETVYTAAVAAADSLDGEARTDTKSIAIPAAGHDWGEWSVSKEATETEEGEESQTCTVCGETQTRVIPKLTHTHHLSKVPAKDAACEEAGNIEYWVCSEGSNPCYRCFADEDGLEEINEADTVIPATGHDWGEPAYGWSDDNTTVMAVRICSHNLKHYEAEAAAVTSAVTKPATCEEKGETTYTSAAFTNPAFTVQTKTVADIDALGHDWGTPTYEWAADHSSVTATRICANDPAHVETETAEAVSMTIPATCEKAGKTAYIADFSHEAFRMQIDEVLLPATGHDWGEWIVDIEATCTEDGSRHHVCGNCWTSESEAIPATGHDMSLVEAVAATCVEDGNVRHYVCGNCGKCFADEAGTEELDQVVIPALGHDWSEPTYGWAADNSAVTAIRFCTHDASHIEWETVAVTSKVTRPATCEERGETTYTTAAFENEAFTIQSKTAANIDATGHAWGKPTYTWSADHSSVTAKRVCANDKTQVETETVKATIATVPATCETAGEKVYTADFKNAAFKTQKFEVVLPATGHKMTKVEAKAATCTKAGNVRYYVCGNCGKYYSDAAGTKKLSTVAIPATGHNMVVTDFKAPTVTETGTETRTCSKCGAKETTVIPRTKLATPAISTRGAVSSRSFNVSWKKIDGATNYQVAYRKAGATKWTTVWAGNKTSYKISGLTKKGAYQIKVRAYRKSDDTYSSYSAVSSRYMMNGTSVKLTSTAAGKLKVTYAKDASASGYKIVYSTSSKMTNTKTITVKGADKVTRTITGLMSGKTYYVYVRPYKVVDGKTYLGVKSAVKSYKVK